MYHARDHSPAQAGVRAVSGTAERKGADSSRSGQRFQRGGPAGSRVAAQRCLISQSPYQHAQSRRLSQSFGQEKAFVAQRISRDGLVTGIIHSGVGGIVVPPVVPHASPVRDRFAELADWQDNNIVALAILHLQNAGARTPADWVDIASLSRFCDHENDVADFARLGGWAMNHLLGLARRYDDAPGRLNLAQWLTVAGHAHFSRQ